MKFFKCHSAKYKDDKAIFLAEQFTEIGPDSFAQTNFEVIILSEYTTTICDHAFSGISNCSIYIPASVCEIDPFAFDDMGGGNVIYCKAGSATQKACEMYKVAYDTNTDICFQKAAKLKETDDQKRQIAQANEQQKREIERIKREALELAEQIKQDAHAHAEIIIQSANETAREIKHSAHIEANDIRQAAIDESIRIKQSAKEEADKMILEAKNKIANTPQSQQSSSPIFKDERNQYGNVTQTGYSSYYRQRQQQRGGSMLKKAASSGPVMKNMDEYDEELQNMRKNKKEKKSWDIF